MKIGIYGYGNLGKGVEKAIKQNSDASLFAVFTRRDPKSLKIDTPTAQVLPAQEVDKYVSDIDVMIICGGSATDLPEMTPSLAEKFNVVDSFDTHADIPTHFDRVDQKAKASGHVALISCGGIPVCFL